MAFHNDIRRAWLGLAGCIASTGVPAKWLASLTLLSSAAFGSVVNEDYLDRLARVESDNRPQAVGKAGELGAYQLKKAAWDDAVRRMFGRIPESYSFCRRNCFDPAKSRVVAREHLLWLERTMVREGHTPTKISLYMSYNLGMTMSERYAHNHRHPSLADQRKAVFARAERIFSP